MDVVNNYVASILLSCYITIMVKRIMIFVDDQEWENFRQSAKERGLLLSKAVADMLKRELARVGTKAPKEPA